MNTKVDPTQSFTGFDTLKMLEDFLNVEQKTQLTQIQSKAKEECKVKYLGRERNRDPSVQYFAVSEVARSGKENVDLHQQRQIESNQKLLVEMQSNLKNNENEFFKIQEEYLSALEGHFEGLQNLKKAKKLSVLRSIRLIQRFLRHKMKQKKKNACNFIGVCYRKYKNRNFKLKERLLKPKRSVAIIKLQNWFRWMIKKMRINKVQLVQQDYSDPNITAKVATLQALVRGFLQRLKFSSNKSVFFHQRAKQSQKRAHLSILSQKIFRQIQSQNMRDFGLQKEQEKFIQNYLLKSVSKFEDQWEAYEKSLKKYLSKFTNFSEWTPQQDQYGQKYWLNIKTLETTAEHPGKKYFEINRRRKRRDAEEKFNKQIMADYDEKQTTLEQKQKSNQSNYSSQRTILGVDLVKMHLN